jgi:hypothetical protein
MRHDSGVRRGGIRGALQDCERTRGVALGLEEVG